MGILKRILSLAFLNPILGIIALLPSIVFIGILVDIYAAVCFAVMAVEGRFNNPK